MPLSRPISSIQAQLTQRSSCKWQSTSLCTQDPRRGRLFIWGFSSTYLHLHTYRYSYGLHITVNIVCRADVAFPCQTQFFSSSSYFANCHLSPPHIVPWLADLSVKSMPFFIKIFFLSNDIRKTCFDFCITTSFLRIHGDILKVHLSNRNFLNHLFPILPLKKNYAQGFSTNILIIGHYLWKN